MGFGGGINFHHLAPANSFGRLIGYGSLNLGLGRAEEAFTIQTIGNTATTNTYNGTMNFISVGYGLKYFTFGGVGFRGIIEYHRVGETYAVDSSEKPFSKTVQGPRMQVGISYRW
jgi:hypothetical protein